MNADTARPSFHAHPRVVGVEEARDVDIDAVRAVVGERDRLSEALRLVVDLGGRRSPQYLQTTPVAGATSLKMALLYAVPQYDFHCLPAQAWIEEQQTNPCFQG
jgi:hypothetical protein